MLSRGDTVGVFQMEGSGMRRFLSDLKPSSFDDVIAAISLFRPGTLDSGMVDPFIKRKHGKEKVEYDHPLLEPVLRDTYGVIVYQEQVMRVAQALSGYTLQEADMLRAAMGKKNKQVMERERARFVEGAVRNGVNQALAQSIFEKIGTFASYGFNRSHAAAYALTTYITAYLKAHFPREFMAALMSLDMDDADKTYKNIAALREMANQDPAARRESEPGQVHGLGGGDPVRPGRDPRRRRQDRRGDDRRARGRRRVHRSRRVLPARRLAARQPARAGGADQVRRVRLDRARRAPS